MVTTTTARTSSTKLRSLVLSDVLRGEKQGMPVTWNRYRADYPKRREITDQLFHTRHVQLTDHEECLLTFYGLLRLSTPEAKRILSDCRKVFDVMAAHYRVVLQAKVPMQEVARRAQITPERALFAVGMLNRGSSVQLNVEPGPLTLGSSLSATDSIVGQSPFRKLVRVTRQMLDSHQPFSLGLLPNFSDEDRSLHLISDALRNFGSQEVIGDWDKCGERVQRDPDGAITSAKSLIESGCKQILDGRGISYSKGTTVMALYKLVTREVKLDPGKETEQALRTILGGCASVVNGLAELRNVHGDSHGKRPGYTRPSSRHSTLAVSLAGAMIAFLLSTDDGRKRP